MPRPLVTRLRRLRRLRLAPLLLLASSIASADPPKRAALKVTVERSERTQARAPVAKAAPASAADVKLEIEVLTSPIHAEQEAILDKLIRVTPDTDVDDKTDLYFRLGELYAKQHRLYRLQAIDLELKHANAAAIKGAADKAQTYLAKAARTYKALTENPAFQSFPQMDLALFVYGYTLQPKYPTEARSVFDKLLKNYPASKYVAEAHLIFAEYYFEQGQLADAEARYQLVLKTPASNAYWYAIYKLGWIQLNRGKHADALETFFKVAEGTAKDPKRAVMNRSAKRDFVRAYSEIGKADKALVAFRRVDAAGAPAMLEILGDFYLEQGKSDKAIYTFRALMTLMPKHANVCRWQYQVALATLTLPGAGNPDRVREIAGLATIYTATRSTKTPQVAECRDNAAAMTGELARAYHAEWAKTFSVDSFNSANALYATYLKTFADAPDAPMTRYYQADLTWSRAEREPDARTKTALWEETALAFTAVVREGKLDAAAQNDAAYASVSAWLYAHHADPRAAKTIAAAPGTVPQPQPIPAREQHMLEAFDLYLTRTKSPPLEDVVQMKFLKANVLRRFDHLSEAVPLFKDIMTNHAGHAAGEDAALLLIDIYIRQNDEPALLALVDRLLANSKLLDGKDDLRDKLEDIKIVAMRKRAEAIERAAAKTKDFATYVACGQAYLDIYNYNPEAARNDEVLYNAGTCFEQGRSLGTAIKMFQLMEKFYPQSKITARAIARLGKTYADLAMYDLAAQKLEQYAKKYAGEADAYTAMNDAVFFWKGVGNDAKAIENTRYFVRTFGTRKPADTAAAAFSLTATYEKQGEAAALIKHLREYIRDHASTGGPARLVIAQAKLGAALFAQSCPVRTVDGACVKVTRERAVRTIRTARASHATSAPTQCGDDSKIKLTVVARDPRPLREAREAFAAAITSYAAVPATAPDVATARHFVGQAKLAQATIALEAFFALAFPTNLDFDPRSPALAKKSMTRFDGWLVGKEAAARRAAESYAAVLELKDSASSIAAAARIGQITQHFADALFTAEIPRDVRSGPYAEDKITAYCDVLTERAEPLAARALEAYSTCLSRSTDLGWFSEWSQLCERELGQIQPDRFPTVSERRSAPDRVAAIVALEAPPRLD